MTGIGKIITYSDMQGDRLFRIRVDGALQILRVAIGIRGRVPALQAYLMRQVTIGPGQEKVFVKLDPALWLGVTLTIQPLIPSG